MARAADVRWWRRIELAADAVSAGLGAARPVPDALGAIGISPYVRFHGPAYQPGLSYYYAPLVLHNSRRATLRAFQLER